MILQNIAKKTKLTPQAVSYALQKLMEQGIVNVFEEEDKRLYVLQKAYYDDNWLNALYALMIPYVRAMQDKMDFSQTTLTPPKAVVSNFLMFLRLFERRVKKLDINSSRSS